MKRSQARIREFDDPRKRELEGWLVIDHRLREVEEALERVHKSLGKARKVRRDIAGASGTTRSDYCFAAVTYMRCFSPGRHRRLSINDIPRLTAKNLKTHTDIRELRNTFFAHAVADQEGEHVYLRSLPGKPIDGFAVISVVLLCDTKQGVRGFMNLVAKVRKYVQAQATNVGDKMAARFFGAGASWQVLSNVREHRE